MKVMAVFGTRPEAIKMFPVVHALQGHDAIYVRVCVTAQHREMLDQVLEIARITPDVDLDVMTPNQSLDALLATKARIDAEPALASGLDALAARFSGQRIIAVTSHRRENFGEGMKAIADAIAGIAAREDVAVVFPVHPNPHVRSAMEPILGNLANVALIDPLDYPHFVRLLGMSSLVLTDSGGVQEEAPSLGKPVLVMRETTERPEGIEAGTARLVGTDKNRIVSEIFSLLDDESAYNAMARAHNPFGDGRAAERIAEIVARAH